jgi:hypothetical protein
MKINRFKSVPFALVLTAALMVSCAQRSELGSLVPESAAFFVQVTGLDTLFSNADAFVKEIGSQALLDNKTVKELVDIQLKEAFEEVSLSMLDSSKPIGLALILPGADDEGDPAPIVYLPLKNMKDDFSKIEKAFGGDSSKVVKAGNYAVVYDAGEEMKFPPEKTLDIGSLAKYKAGSLSYMVNVKGLLAQYGAMLDAGIEAGLNELEDTEGLDDAQTTALLDKIGKLLVDAVRQTELLDGSLFLAKDGLESYSSIAFAKDKGLANFASALGSTRGTASFVKYLPKDHFMSMSTNMSAQAQKLASDFMMELLSDFPGFTQENVEFFRKSAEKQLALIGTKAAFGFDFGLDIGALTELESASTTDVGAVMEKAFDAFAFKLAAVYAAKNGAAYMDHFKSIYQDPAFKAMMNASLKSTGIGVDFTFEDMKEGDLAYQLMKINMKTSGSEISGMDDKTAAVVFQGIKNKLPTYLAAFKDKMFMTMGDDGLPTLSSLVKSDAHPEDLSKDPAYAAFLKLAGDDGQLLMRISTNRLLSFITTIISAGSGNFQNFEIPAESSTGLWTMVRARGNSIQTVGFWSAKEIAVVIQQAMSLYTQYMQQAMSGFADDEDYADWGEYEGVEGFSGD